VLIGSPATHIVLAAGATDMRKSFDTLAAIVRNELGGDPISGHLFVFWNKRKDRSKVLYFDGSGLWVCAKRLEKGTFSWPETRARSVELRREELVALLGGLDLRTTKRRRWYRHAELSTSSAQAR
jgi:transposase